MSILRVIAKRRTKTTRGQKHNLIMTGASNFWSSDSCLDEWLRLAYWRKGWKLKRGPCHETKTIDKVQVGKRWWDEEVLIDDELTLYNISSVWSVLCRVFHATTFSISKLGPSGRPMGQTNMTLYVLLIVLIMAWCINPSDKPLPLWKDPDYGPWLWTLKMDPEYVKLEDIFLLSSINAKEKPSN
jgi:hypothetical protein